MIDESLIYQALKHSQLNLLGLQAEGFRLCRRKFDFLFFVIPVETGIQVWSLAFCLPAWMPAYAGMTELLFA